MVMETKYRDQYQIYLTSDQSLSSYMVSLLKLENHDQLLEPSAGEGHLLEAALQTNKNISSVAYELHPEYAKKLRLKFSQFKNVEIRERDTIFCRDLDLCEYFGYKFTKILGNPPYGGWQEYDRRTELKRKYPGFYIRETYTIFLLRCLKLLAEKGQLVFIIPDTFLYLHSHINIRRYLLKEFTIESIDIFRSSLFPGISFGYAGLCIISIYSQKPQYNHSFAIRFIDKIADLHLSLNQSNYKSILQKDILKSESLSIPISRHDSVVTQISSYVTKMADIADCVTGFYSGNDKIFLRKASTSVKGSTDYLLVDPNAIESTPSTLQNPLQGIAGTKHFIPILKGGGFNFIKPTQWYVDWSWETVEYYKNNKKSRFQNSSYYFKTGIGFPMVTSKRPTAALIEESLFDQSIVGIFPKSSVDLYFLLAYCNSPVFWLCLKSINPSANNSAKYILKTPVILPDEDTMKDISWKTQELVLEIKEDNQKALCEILQQEIIDSIMKYVNKQISYKLVDTSVMNMLSTCCQVN
ncbi:Eco57I restriction-modification methylase domain-containing protein [Dolichospermum flos-aquae]|uniref:Eco57I restriction-modification methylase domain-containing protein n=1 Tax=Dolichospermum flos-aquae LEGE 04289 TaxID=1828708 RepID=A0ACC5PXV1_DOLFA|nr:N-6 DNA methylase [Dolichospermum flos-aquae]MBE9218013.1 Eco57I restriction-modification methylase domain-containing protein [Dolichospermum flos-aquae LEGE 04289]